MAQSIFLSCRSYLHTSFTMVEGCLPSITKSSRAKTFRWCCKFYSCVKADSWERMAPLWRVFYYSVSPFCTYVYFIHAPWQKWQAHLLSSKIFTLFVIQYHALISPRHKEQRKRGWYHMENGDEIMIQQSLQNCAVKIFSFSCLLHFTGETTGWSETQRGHPRHTTQHGLNGGWLKKKNWNCTWKISSVW